MVLINTHTASAGLQVISYRSGPNKQFKLGVPRVKVILWQTEANTDEGPFDKKDCPRLVTYRMDLIDVLKCAESDLFEGGFSSQRDKVITGALGIVGTSLTEAYAPDETGRNKKILDSGDVPCKYFEMYFGPEPVIGWPKHMKCIECGRDPNSRLEEDEVIK